MSALQKLLNRMAWGSGRLRELTRSAVSTPHLRGEVFWVVLHKALEFILFFVQLKVFTNVLGKENYGEYALAITSLQVLMAALVMPVQQAYLRYLHRANEEGVGRAAGRTVLQWYSVATFGVLLCALLLTEQFAEWFGLEGLTALAAGLVFLGNGWRLLGTNVLDIRRRRRDVAILNLGFLASTIAVVAVLAKLITASASIALFGMAAAAIFFAGLSLKSLLSMIGEQPPARSSELMSLVRSYGLPAGALLVFQWFQNLIDRYILAILLSKEAVGLYTAGYQACGVPYMAAFSVVYTLLRPIAFQRAKDVRDARQVWVADRLLLGGIAFYLILGALAVPVYALFGPRIMLLLTAKDFYLASHTLVFLALLRYVQCLTILVGVFFNVHHRMKAALVYRAIGAAVTLPISWLAIRWYGVTGAAVGGFLAMSLYLGLMCMGPRGCVWFVLHTRRRLRRQSSGPEGIQAGP